MEKAILCCPGNVKLSFLGKGLVVNDVNLVTKLIQLQKRARYHGNVSATMAATAQHSYKYNVVQVRTHNYRSWSSVLQENHGPTCLAIRDAQLKEWFLHRKLQMLQKNFIVWAAVKYHSVILLGRWEYSNLYSPYPLDCNFGMYIPSPRKQAFPPTKQSKVKERRADLEMEMTTYKDGRAKGAGVAFVVFKDVYISNKAVQDFRSEKKKRVGKFGLSALLMVVTSRGWISNRGSQWNEKLSQMGRWACHAVGSYRKKPMTTDAFSADGFVLAVAAETFIILFKSTTLSMEFIGHTSLTQKISTALNIACSGKDSLLAVLVVFPDSSKAELDGAAVHNGSGAILLFSAGDPVPIASWVVTKGNLDMHPSMEIYPSLVIMSMLSLTHMAQRCMNGKLGPQTVFRAWKGQVSAIRAITSAQQKLQLYSEVPPNGLALFGILSGNRKQVLDEITVDPPDTEVEQIMNMIFLYISFAKTI
ncbi:WD repeat-containing protein 75 [Tanacetum coccineum]|uniref:WD repeat-containing protein 75 n=1 Tax=Tanacetum coccineum TaxID=301880 RepID=A0ABQ5EC46_9ASTR